MSSKGINLERLEATLERDEGCNLKRHEVQDVDHIGYGINLETELPDELLDYLGVEDEDDIQEISQEQADYLLAYFVGIAVADCISIYGAEVWDGLSDLRREVLLNISFNLGINRHKGFRKMNAAVKAGDWAEASAQMLDSKAAKQTGERYPRLSMAFESDDQTFLDLPDFQDEVITADANDDDDENPLAKYTDEELLAEVKRRMSNV